MRVLAIDDEQLVLLPLQKKLEELGYKVCITIDAIKGIELYDTFKPDLIIVDINMPKLSGIEFIKHLRTIKKSSTPIMVFSGNTSADIITEGFKFGINDYMIKPLSLNEIYARIKRLNIYFQTY